MPLETINPEEDTAQALKQLFMNLGMDEGRYARTLRLDAIGDGDTVSRDALDATVHTAYPGVDLELIAATETVGDLIDLILGSDDPEREDEPQEASDVADLAEAQLRETQEAERAAQEQALQAERARLLAEGPGDGPGDGQGTAVHTPPAPSLVDPRDPPPPALPPERDPRDLANAGEGNDPPTLPPAPAAPPAPSAPTGATGATGAGEQASDESA